MGKNVPDDDKGSTGSTGGKTFTQADLEYEIGKRLDRERSKYADYDDLKRKAADADKTKSDVDKLTDAVKALTERAEKAERDGIRRDVADRFKLPKSLAAKLGGTTKEDLEREAKELVDELTALGVKFDDGKDAGKNGGDGKAGESGKAGENGGDAGKDGKQGAGDGTGSGNGDDLASKLGGGRPKENLRSGSVPSGGETIDYGKTAESILGNRMF